MIQKLVYILIFLFVCPTLNYATVIEGLEPDYANRTIPFYSYSDPITKNKKDLFSIQIESDGRFSTQVDIKETTVCYADFDVYSGMLILEPDKNIAIKLPRLKIKTFSEEKNPYFKPTQMWIKVASDDNEEINQVCYNFEKQYNELIDKNFNQLYFRQSKLVLDSVTVTLKSGFQKFHHPFIKNLIHFKLKVLEGEVLRQNQDKALIGVKASDFTYFNPGFIDILDRVFTNKLVFESNSINGNDIRNIINKGDLFGLKEFVQEKYELQPGVDELVILKLLHDAYYSGNFSKQAILSMLNNDLYKKNKNPQLRKFATSIHDKLLYLSPGTLAPEICLPNMVNETICTSQGEKYKYVMFVDMEIQICREHLKYLPEISKKYQNKLDIFVIIKNPKSKKIQDFIHTYNIKAEILFDTDYGKKYTIKSYPSCFLFGKKHKVLMNPAKSPLDGFENQFRDFLKNELFKQNQR